VVASQDGTKKGDLRYCAAVEGYFDDENHYQEIKYVSIVHAFRGTFKVMDRC
jgi:hypothetical protein